MAKWQSGVVATENRPNSKAKIWKRTIYFVPLQSIREMLCECGLRLGKANKFDFSTRLAPPLQYQSESHPTSAHTERPPDTQQRPPDGPQGPHDELTEESR